MLCWLKALAGGSPHYTHSRSDGIVTCAKVVPTVAVIRARGKPTHLSRTPIPEPTAQGHIVITASYAGTLRIFESLGRPRRL